MIRALTLLLALTVAACAADEGDAGPASGGTADAGGLPDGFGGIGGAPQGDVAPDTGPPGCATHDDCGSLYCDRYTGACVACLAHAHCAEPTPVCRASACEAAVPCGEAPCPDGVCVDGRCADCAADGDCASGVCRAGVCASGVVACGATTDCAPYSMQCAAGACVDCLVDAHCPVADFCGDGVCQPDACVPGTIAPACRDAGTVARCADSGSGYEDVPCGEGWLCEPAVGGAKSARCAEVACSPGARTCTTDTSYGICNEFGTAFVEVTCPAGTSCYHGECRPAKPVIVVVFDTSSSMWGYPQGGVPDLCEKLGTTCVPPWPSCEAGTDGLTLMGRSKQVFSQLFETFAGAAHFALLRFPQREVATTPTCKTGWYAGLPTIEGDTDAHVAPEDPDGWFARGLGQVALALPPAAVGESNLPQIQAWLDFEETLSVGAECAEDGDCDAGFCAPPSEDPGGAKRCHTHDDPELRPAGQTPLGRSLFYAGEVIRQRVVVDGQACASDEDCGTQFHVCADGVCHDPGRACRKLVVLLFTDGAESVDTSLDSWFHPRNQAKRLHYGLGCGGDADCLSGATCADGVCTPPDSGAAPAPICSDTGTFCQTDAECKAGTCGPDVSDYVDADGVQRLEDAGGAPIAVTISVVTVGYEKGHAASIATWGGGEAVSVQDASADVLLDELSKVVTTKIQAECTQ